MNHGLVLFSSKAFRMEVIAVISMVHLFSNGGMVDQSHERYLQWQQHRAEHLMPSTPLSTGVKSGKKSTAEIFFCVVYIPTARLQQGLTVDLQYYGFKWEKGQA